MSEKKSMKQDKLPRRPTGTRDLVGEHYLLVQGFFEKAAEIALYYDFSPIETPTLEESAIFMTGLGEDTDIVSKEMYTLKTKGGSQLAMRPEGTAGVMRAYIENGMQSLPQPVKLYYAGSFFRHERPQRGRWREFKQFGIEVLGAPKSIADAMVVMILMKILEEAGCSRLSVQLNSIGDRDCRTNYRRALVAYYRKHISDLCEDCKERLKTNPLRLLDCKNEKCVQLKTSAPDTLGHLCVACREHFTEVLEYLETLGINYTLNNSLVRGIDYYSRTVFEILEEVTVPAEENASEHKTVPLAVAGGGRYDYLARALGGKKDVAAVGGSIGVDRALELCSIKHLMPRIVKKPKAYFIQLGFEAKLHSLIITEILRKAHIPIAHSLAKDSLSAQLATAEKLSIPYAIILGQKEVIDNTVIIRTMETRSQEVVPVPELLAYVKRELK
ncbi:MAG: histidine--tRNA ligase [Candidatus Vogelbacteria bacterium]|nr:histidine--tRNA ligase [Candidatus Vogelbacteria bacterium]